MATAYFQEGCSYRNDSTEVPSTPFTRQVSSQLRQVMGSCFRISCYASSLKFTLPTHPLHIGKNDFCNLCVLLGFYGPGKGT